MHSRYLPTTRSGAPPSLLIMTHILSSNLPAGVFQHFCTLIQIVEKSARVAFPMLRRRWVTSWSRWRTCARQSGGPLCDPPRKPGRDGWKPCVMTARHTVSPGMSGAPICAGPLSVARRAVAPHRLGGARSPRAPSCCGSTTPPATAVTRHLTTASRLCAVSCATLNTSPLPLTSSAERSWRGCACCAAATARTGARSDPFPQLSSGQEILAAPDARVQDRLLARVFT